MRFFAPYNLLNAKLGWRNLGAGIKPKKWGFDVLFYYASLGLIHLLNTPLYKVYLPLLKVYSPL